MSVRLAPLLICALSLAAFGIHTSAAAAVHKTELQSLDFPSPEFRTVTVRTVIDVGDEVKPHTHPGLEMAYVVEGKGRLIRSGTAVRLLNAGDSFAIAEKTIHSVANIGSSPLTIVSTYVVDKDKPLSSPASAAR